MDESTLTILSKAIERLKGLSESDYEEAIIGAKAMDVGLRLAAQFCMRGLLASGMTKTKIAQQLKLDNSTPGYWLMARVTPRLDRFTSLVELYRQVCAKEYHKARETEALTD